MTCRGSRGWIATGYFVPDDVLRAALELAANRGVDVRLLVAEKNHHPCLVIAGRSYYDELLAAGLRIFEYSAGTNHAKIAVADQHWAMVGSANLDYRSMRLTFELNLLSRSPAFWSTISRSARKLIRRCSRVGSSAKDLLKRHYGRSRRCSESVALACRTWFGKPVPPSPRRATPPYSPPDFRCKVTTRRTISRLRGWPGLRQPRCGPEAPVANAAGNVASRPRLPFGVSILPSTERTFISCPNDPSIASPRPEVGPTVSSTT